MVFPDPLLPTIAIYCPRLTSILTSLLQAEKVILMDNGKVVGSGTHDELRNNNQIYNNIFNKQYQDKEGRLYDKEK